MNAPKLIPKSNRVLETSDNLPSKGTGLSALRKPRASLTSAGWRMGFAFLLLGTPWVRADVLPNNFWVNPTFELGSDLNQTTGTVSNWNRGGGDSTICQVITDNSVSSSHS